ncbi:MULTISPECIES: hypothetical protein [unclassified Pseudoclavibacter]|jgi:hypothetical protein|uniref:hypothetical protein n=1 Tax=unclassified Pseudoclavibacter TaxID=2615177 RepID=UPI0015CB9B9C|nr:MULTISPECIES: hypothetical protein [unclassified Pseudoclavibacter]MBS3178445.1 hypothetical protein [Pseudoclavibacter sp. Marseille-Q4354]NYF14189.1 hypothetical protein [Pseudoclavibacter sp. JAI123]
MTTAILRRKDDLPRARAASRLTAYVYGNIIILATLLGLVHAGENPGEGAIVVLATGGTTLLAHLIADAVGHSTRAEVGDRRERTAHIEFLHELRDAVPIASAASIPAAILGVAALGVIDGETAQLVAEIVIIVRLAAMGFTVQRIRGERPSFRTFAAGVGLALIGVAISVLKANLGH